MITSFNEKFTTQKLIKVFPVNDDEIAISFCKNPSVLTIFRLATNEILSEIEVSNREFLFILFGQLIVSISPENYSYDVKIWNYYTEELVSNIHLYQELGNCTINRVRQFQTYNLVLLTENNTIFLLNVLNKSLKKMDIFSKYDAKFHNLWILQDRYICANTTTLLWGKARNILLIHDTHVNRCYELDTNEEVLQVNSIDDKVGIICFQQSVNYWDFSELKNISTDSKQVKISGLSEKTLSKLSKEIAPMKTTYFVSKSGDIFFFNDKIVTIIQPHRARESKLRSDAEFRDIEMITYKR